MGALIRRIGIATRDGEARAAVEDDFHHFRVSILHDGACVAGAQAQAPRRPWTACALAADRLTELIGMELSPRASAVMAHTEQRLQCTHMFDIAGLAIAAAARGIATRRYEAVVPDRIGRKSEPVLTRDGVEVMRWKLDGAIITAPALFAGVGVHAGFSQWVDTHLSLDDAEAALVLRRAVFISGGRGRDLDSAIHAPARGGCFVQQPERAESVKRMIGSTFDFTDRPGALLADDQPWLAFA